MSVAARAPPFIDPPGYARHRPETSVVHRTICRHLIRKAGLTRASGATGAVTLVQRFGSALNLNVHFHMLFPDGVYRADGRSAG